MGFGKDGKGVIFLQEDGVSLGTLATETSTKQAAVPAFTDSFRVIKSEGHGHVEFATAVEGDGPVAIYLVSDDLSIAEIDEVFSSAGKPLSREDVVGQAEVMRPIFYLTQFKIGPDAAGEDRIYFEWSKTIRWTFGDAKGFVLVFRNEGSGALTAGCVPRFVHKAYGVWVGA